jgi:hypothetical protein
VTGAWLQSNYEASALSSVDAAMKNLGLEELSENGGISIIDVDTIVARHGACLTSSTFWIRRYHEPRVPV